MKDHVRFYQGITELRTTDPERCAMFLFAAGLGLTLDGYEGEGRVGTVEREGNVWVARFWYPFELEMWKKLLAGDSRGFQPWS